MRVFVSAGEASGDRYGAAFMREMRARKADLQFQALGGALIQQQGAEIVADASAWGAIGIAQALRVAPRVMRGVGRVKRALGTGTPGLFVPIDFGFVNVGLARHAKGLGWKVLYFVPPGSWKRDAKPRDLPSVADAISTPFPWSAEMLRAAGVDAHWFGHPVKQLLAEAGGGVEKRETIAILPGSRAHEIRLNLPAIARAVENLAQPVEFAVASSVDPDRVQAAWRRLAPARSDRFTMNGAYGVLGRARVAIVCSGTATLEAALARTPMAVLYRVSPGMKLEARLLLKGRPTYIALPNLLLERMAVREFVDTEIDAAALGSEIAALLEEGEQRRAQLAAFEELDALLGPADAISRTADLAISMLGP